MLDLLRSAKRPLQLVFEVAKPQSSRKKMTLSTGGWLEDAKRAAKEEEAREAERLKREEEERAAAKLADEHANRPLPVPRSKHHAALPLCAGFLFAVAVRHRLACCYGPAVTDLLLRTCCYGPPATDLLLRTSCYGPAVTDLLLRTSCY